MVTVSPALILSHLKERKVKKTHHILEEDLRIQTFLKMANMMAVTRLRYNDHGLIHSRITAGSALEILNILSKEITPNAIKDHGLRYEDAKVIVLCGAYLHDIGNAVHREKHNLHGCYLMSTILDDILFNIYKSRERALKIKCEILHCIYAHDERIWCLSLEAGVVKVADGTDMAEGRARIPYDLGKIDIHSLSALAIRKVEIEEGEERPVKIKVFMDNPAGIFQIEQVLARKIETSAVKQYIEVAAIENEKEIKVFRG